MEALDLDRITICTPAGLKTIERGDVPVSGVACDHCTAFSQTLVPTATDPGSRTAHISIPIGWARLAGLDVPAYRIAPFFGRGPPEVSFT